MLFNSAGFIFLYLPAVLAGAFLLARFRPGWTIAWLALASFAFYAWWDWRFLPLLIGSIVFNHAIGGQIDAASTRGAIRRGRIWLAVGVSGDLALLGLFKYAGFLAATGAALAGHAAPELGIILPLGISFFTFTQIAFLVDVSRGAARAGRITSYALFVSYFPHLIAGPILHHGEMIPQFERKHAVHSVPFQFDWENIAVGLTIFAIGLFKKVMLADELALLVKPGFDAVTAHQGVPIDLAWLSALAYTLQLYFDFSGYSDMAIGLSRMLGVQLPINFDSPYKAASIIDFWRRWHMTLSRFLRDYLYFPLGGNRFGPTRRYLNLMIVMLLGGLWHGAGWTFVAWGGLHGVYLVVNHLWRGFAGEARLPTAVSRAITFLAVLFAWVMFRATDFSAALGLWMAMLGRPASGPAEAGSMTSPGDWLLCLLLLGLAWFAPNTQQIMRSFRPGIGGEAVAAACPSWRPGVATALAVTLLLAPALYFVVFTHRVSDFLYFQF